MPEDFHSHAGILSEDVQTGPILGYQELIKYTSALFQGERAEAFLKRGLVEVRQFHLVITAKRSLD